MTVNLKLFNRKTPRPPHEYSWDWQWRSIRCWYYYCAPCCLVTQCLLYMEGNPFTVGGVQREQRKVDLREKRALFTIIGYMPSSFTLRTSLCLFKHFLYRVERTNKLCGKTLHCSSIVSVVASFFSYWIYMLLKRKGMGFIPYGFYKIVLDTIMMLITKTFYLLSNYITFPVFGINNGL